MAGATDFTRQEKVYHFGLQWECYRVVVVRVVRSGIFHPGAVDLADLAAAVLAAAALEEAGKLKFQNNGLLAVGPNRCNGYGNSHFVFYKIDVVIEFFRKLILMLNMGQIGLPAR